MKVAVIGAGYVGTSIALVFGKRHDVCYFDVDQSKCDRIAKGLSPIDDEDCNRFFIENAKRIHVAPSIEDALSDAQACFICVPTPLNNQTNKLDVSIICSLLKQISDSKIAKSSQIFIRSTINVKDIACFSRDFPTLNIHSFPEFLREKHVYEDSLCPSRIVIGDNSKDELSAFINNYLEGLKNKPEVMIVSNEEAMAIKLLSNSYLAMRVAFFNEVDSLADSLNIDSSKVIHGMGLDPRIGDYYNSPSRGFGGKCLPKDLRASTSMMKENGIEHPLLEAVDLSNEERKKRFK